MTENSPTPADTTAPTRNVDGLLRGVNRVINLPLRWLSTDQFVEQFTASVSFDRRLYQEDIEGSIAHARMLEKIGVLSADECTSIAGGLNDILAEISSGTFNWRVELEDVHMNIEHRLIERIGDTGKKLHTGRSRNDQVATDIRLYLRKAIDELI